MNTTTVNAFPASHTFTSSRAWVLAFIVLLHAGLLWALSSRLSVQIVQFIPDTFDVAFVQDASRRTPPRHPVTDVRIADFTPSTSMPAPGPISERDTDLLPDRVAPTGNGDSAAPEASIVAPSIDPHASLSEPLYPPLDIRMRHAGTVVLSIEVLPNGRVGAVRIHQSSGYMGLDESAMREARHWRLRPGTRDGVPVTMWKQIPITFRLHESVRF